MLVNSIVVAVTVSSLLLDKLVYIDFGVTFLPSTRPHKTDHNLQEEFRTDESGSRSDRNKSFKIEDRSTASGRSKKK